MIRKNRSSFKVRPSHLLPPPTCTWVDRSIVRRRQPCLPSTAPPTSFLTQPHHYDHQLVFANNCRSVTRSNCYTFYEDCNTFCNTFRINHIDIDQSSINIYNQLYPKASAAEESGPSLNSNHDNHENNSFSFSERQHDAELEAMESGKCSGVPGARAFDVDKMNLNYTDDSQFADDTDHINCSTDIVIAEEQEDEFTFSTSVTDSAEFFEFTVASSSSLHASQRWESISYMASADELFENGKIRALLPALISVSSDEPNSSNSVFYDNSLSNGTMEANKGSMVPDHGAASSSGNGDLANSSERIDERLDETSREGIHHAKLPFKKFGSLRECAPIGCKMHEIRTEEAQGFLRMPQDWRSRERFASKRRTAFHECPAPAANSLQQLPIRKSRKFSLMKKIMSPFHKTKTEKMETRTFFPCCHWLLQCLGYKCPL